MVFPQRCPILLLQQTTSCNPFYKWITCIFATSAVANFLLGGLTVFEDMEHRSLEAWTTARGPQETCSCVSASEAAVRNYYILVNLSYVTLFSVKPTWGHLHSLSKDKCAVCEHVDWDKAVSVPRYLVQNDTGILALWNKTEGHCRMSTEVAEVDTKSARAQTARDMEARLWSEPPSPNPIKPKHTSKHLENKYHT